MNTKGVLERFKMLRKLHQLSFITILEPLSDSVHLQSFKVQLHMDNATNNCNGNIWFFWSNYMDCNILDKDEQQITCNMKHNELQYKFYSTFIYAKCKYHPLPLPG